jgi:hypothetical protein
MGAPVGLSNDLSGFPWFWINRGAMCVIAEAAARVNVRLATCTSTVTLVPLVRARV